MRRTRYVHCVAWVNFNLIDYDLNYVCVGADGIIDFMNRECD